MFVLEITEYGKESIEYKDSNVDRFVKSSSEIIKKELERVVENSDQVKNMRINIYTE